MSDLSNQKKVNERNDLPVLAGLLAVILFFMATGFVTYSNTLGLQSDAKSVARTHEVITALDNLQSLMKDAETGQRGYLLTGKDEYLVPYDDARLKIGHQFSDLQKLIADNPQEQARLFAIEATINQKFKELSETISVRRKQGLDQALAIVMTGHGKRAMDDLRSEVDDMRALERQVRVARIVEMENSYKTAIITGIVSALLGVVLSIVIATLLHRAAEARRHEEWLQNAKVGLAAVMSGTLSTVQLGQNILKFLAEYLDAHAAVFFAKSGAHYNRVATYGFPDNKYVLQNFDNGGGLLQQAVQDARAFVVRDVPDGYLHVGSGLGQSNPRTLLIAPAINDEMVNGALELGFIHPLDDRAITLLDQVSGLMGIALQAAEYRENLQRLLEETQSQGEELQAQSEELRVSNEELEEQSRNLQESQSRLEQQQEELEASNEEMEEKARLLEDQNLRILSQSRDLKETKDILERKAKDLELASKYKSEFLANMSHELRTPLNSLLILARSLAGNEDGNLTNEQVEEARIIHNGGLELLTLINDILDLSKVEAGKLNVVAEDVSLNNMLRKLDQQFQPVARDGAITFDLGIDGDVPASIHTDGQRVEQILKNLLSNAFKFTEEGGVSLSVSMTPSEKVIFSVIDTGIGIEPSKLNDIFEAFQQEDGSTDRHYGGTGLGLTIARKFAHMLGGEIGVSSRKGEGSVFTLTLPLRMVQQNPVAPEKVMPSQQDMRAELRSMPQAANRTPTRVFVPDDRGAIGGKDKVLLIIEDDKDFASTLVKIARKRGYKCLAAGDGKTGLLLASEYPVRAIILDLKLPDMDGITVLDHLKHDLRTRHMPVHIITGRGDVDNVVPLRKGAIGYLTKPVQAEDIDGAFGKIEGLLESQMKKILVVEDDKNSQAAIQRLLKKKDVEITMVGSGKIALKRIHEQAFDCIILDLQLPDMNGFEWLEKAEAEMVGTEPPPVIIYTARELSEEENRRLNRYTGSIVIKGASSSERLLDEVTLFLHSVESTLTQDQQVMIRMQHDPDKVLQNRTALLVDDDMRNTFALSKLLKKHGMNVILADNGQMALEKLRENEDIELVIMDIMMPVMDGYQAMRAIRAQKQYEGLPIIALTARAMPEEQERCLEAGANDYMMKPVDIDRLLTLLRVWLFRQEAAA